MRGLFLIFAEVKGEEDFIFLKLYCHWVQLEILQKYSSQLFTITMFVY